MDGSPGKFESVLDDGDFLLQLAEECVQERLEAKGLADPVVPHGPPRLAEATAASSMPRNGTQAPKSTQLTRQHSLPGVATGSAAATGFYVEPLSGLKVARPVVGSVIVRERLSDRPFVKLAAIKQMAGSGPPANDWATVAVLSSKVQLEARTGGTYSKWQLTDLDSASACLFLFGAAHRDLYKESEGSVIILYGAKVSQQQGGGWSLRVDHPEQVSRIGHSPDLAYCRGTKSDGNPCRHIVNRSKCEYCPYHAARALKQLQSQRPDLRGRNMLEAHLRPTALKAEELYRRNSAPAVPPPLLSGRQLSDRANSLRARTIAGSRGANTTVMMNVDRAAGSLTAAGTNAVGLKRSRGLDAVLAVADQDMATEGGQGTRPKSTKVELSSTHSRHSTPAGTTARTSSAQVEESDVELGGSDDENQPPSCHELSGPKARLLELVKLQRVEQDSNTATQQAATISSRAAAAAQAVVASRQAHAVSQARSNRPSQAGAVQAQQAAIRQHAVGPLAGLTTATHQPVSGPLQSSSRLNITNNTGSTVQAARKAVQDPLKSKMMANLGLAKRATGTTAAAGPLASHQGGSGGAGRSVSAAAKAAAASVMVTAAPSRGPVSAMAAAFGAIAQQAGQLSEDHKEPESRYQQSGEEAGWQELLGRLDDLDKKDALQQQLDSVKNLKVSAFQCSECNTFTEYKRKECCEAGHHIAHVQTTKRFWQCTHCNARSSSLGVIYPKRRCPRCNDPGMDFKPTTMYAGPRGNKPSAEGQGIAAKENMLPRGTEHGLALIAS